MTDGAYEFRRHTTMSFTATLQQERIINWFLLEQHLPVNVNDKEYDCEEGITTEGGYYKNGFKAQIRKIKEDKIIGINIYTSASNQIGIEEKFIFKVEDKKYKLHSWRGWNNLDLMKFKGAENEWYNMLNAIYKNNYEE